MVTNQLEFGPFNTYLCLTVIVISARWGASEAGDGVKYENSIYFLVVIISSSSTISSKALSSVVSRNEKKAQILSSEIL